MATAFRIHEDIENLLEAKKDRKNVATGKNASAANDKNQMQQQRSTFAILNNVDYDGGRNVAATHAQKSVSTTKNILRFYLMCFVISSLCLLCSNFCFVNFLKLQQFDQLKKSFHLAVLRKILNDFFSFENHMIDHGL